MRCARSPRLLRESIPSAPGRARWRGALLGLLAPLLLFALSGCPSNCERACGKLAFCGLLPGVDQETCVERCEEEQEPSRDDSRVCGDCADQSSCRTIANGSCNQPCELIFGPEVGGEGGDGGGGGEGGAGGAGGGG